MDGYFYINSNSNDKVETFNEDDYIKSLKAKISVLKAQISILKADNKRLIKKLEGKTNEFNRSNDI